jgi:hypothetical protein
MVPIVGVIHPGSFHERVFLFSVLMDFRWITFTVCNGLTHGLDRQIEAGGNLLRSLARPVFACCVIAVQNACGDARAIDEKLAIVRTCFGRQVLPPGWFFKAHFMIVQRRRDEDNSTCERRLTK